MHEVDMPKLKLALIWTPTFVCVSDYVWIYEVILKKYMFKIDWIAYSKYANYSRFVTHVIERTYMTT